MTHLSKNVNGELLWKRFQSGDEAAFSLLYESYIQIIYNYGRKFSDDEAFIEDCIHGLFLDMWKNRNNLSVPTSIKFYLYASLKRRMHKELLKKKEVAYEDLSVLEKNMRELNHSIEDVIISTQNKVQQRVSLKQGLLALSDNQRKAILLKFYKNLSFQEISLAMDMSIDNVYKLVSRGLVALKKNVKNLEVA